jgi:hypothetical protein
MGKVLAAFEELGKPILWGMGWVNRRLGSFGGHPLTLTFVLRKYPNAHLPQPKNLDWVDPFKNFGNNNIFKFEKLTLNI